MVYAGTEVGLYLSRDSGLSFARLKSETLPAVAVHDILVHPRDNDLILGTHGRGLFIFDDATPIQFLGSTELFDVRPALRFTMMPTRYGIGDEPFRGPNPPYGALITFELKEAAEADAAPKSRDSGWERSRCCERSKTFRRRRECTASPGISRARSRGRGATSRARRRSSPSVLSDRRFLPGVTGFD